MGILLAIPTGIALSIVGLIVDQRKWYALGGAVVSAGWVLLILVGVVIQLCR
jgi:hypothetical protein